LAAAICPIGDLFEPAFIPNFFREIQSMSDDLEGLSDEEICDQRTVVAPPHGILLSRTTPKAKAS
jgi:hypothetical protein